MGEYLDDFEFGFDEDVLTEVDPVLAELFDILEVPENASILDKAREVMEVYYQTRGN